MAFNKKHWEDLPDQTTPVDATELNRIEDGIKYNDDRLEGISSAGNMIVDSIRSKNEFGGYVTLNGIFINAGTNTLGSNSNATCVYIPIKPNTTYTVSKTKGNRFAIGFTNATPEVNVALTGVEDDRTAPSLTSTSANDSKYLIIYISLSDTETFDNIVATIQVEEGNTATTYAPYQCLNGGVVDSQTSANGNDSYIKFADGTMICTKFVSLSNIAIDIADGVMYRSDNLSLGDWLTPFKSKPIYTISQNSGTSVGMVYYLTGASSTSAGTVRILRTTANSSANWGAGIIAIGRWK